MQKNITYFSSSGDNGATDYADLSSTVLSKVPTTSFAPDSPWVTSVGGTSVMRTSNSFHEVAWNRSGGGLSRFYQTPSYQKTLPASAQSILNNRRGVPDVSANGDPNTGMAIYYGGGWSLGGGTSASAPVWAAVMSIVNQKAGHSLGFINPGLYKLAASNTYAQDFHDITEGNNSINGIQGFYATVGWDAVTGLGTPNAQNLVPDLIGAM
jgi:subtilase family serine protease